MGAIDLILAPLDPTSTLLVRRAKAGDREAFEALLRQHERMVLRTALRLLGRLHLAQDAAQEVFLRLHKYLRRFDEERELAPWLYRMVVNVCHDLRRAGSRDGVGLDEVDEPADPAAAELDAGLDREVRRRLVARALEVLPPKERAALVLRDIEGLPTGEVARILGTAEVTVRAHVSRARVRLKKQVEEWLQRRP